MLVLGQELHKMFPKNSSNFFSKPVYIEQQYGPVVLHQFFYRLLDGCRDCCNFAVPSNLRGQFMFFVRLCGMAIVLSAVFS